MVQTFWNPKDDAKVLKKLSASRFIFVDLLPSKYQQDLSDTFDWEAVRARYHDAGLNIRSVQGFFFGGDFSVCLKSHLWPVTHQRFLRALSVAERLGAENLILGSPQARYCEHPFPKSCMFEGLAILDNVCRESRQSLLVENLPKAFDGAFASNINAKLVSQSEFFFCFDIGNHFSRFNDYGSALIAMNEILPSKEVRHVQANLLDTQVSKWVDRYLLDNHLKLDYVAVEGPLGSLGGLPEQLKGFFDSLTAIQN